MAEKITPRSQNYPQWYLDVVRQAGLADNSEVRGCMVIKPNGYALWEKMQRGLDRLFKDTGHVNAYFPLFIPKSYFAKEEEMAEGFAKECAVVTHYRLKTVEEAGKRTLVVDPEAELEEPLVIRPTSETIIWRTYKEWIQSYRDLPLLINQWCNVVRWEMRTRLFLRTTEFLWQEGHTAHATQKEAEDETLQMVRVYQKFAEEFMAMPVLVGPKTEGQKFPGAVYTLCIEAMMQDGKALQSGTSHFLGQNFAKAFDVQFQSEQNKQEYAWATSWGVSTRLIGGLLMTHSDDNGLVVPPRLAPTHVVICPLGRNEAERAPALAAAEKLAAELRALPRDEFFGYEPIAVKIDNDMKNSPGFRFAEYEVRGVPVRVEIGPKDIEKSALRGRPPRRARQGGQAVRHPVGRRRGVRRQAPARHPAGALRQGEGVPRGEHRDREHAGRVPRLLPGREGRRGVRDRGDEVRLGALGRHPGDGGPGAEGVQGDDPLPAVRRPDRAGACIFTGKPSAKRVVFARAY